MRYAGDMCNQWRGPSWGSRVDHQCPDGKDIYWRDEEWCGKAKPWFPSINTKKIHKDDFYFHFGSEWSISASLSRRAFNLTNWAVRWSPKACHWKTLVDVENIVEFKFFIVKRHKCKYGPVCRQLRCCQVDCAASHTQFPCAEIFYKVDKNCF